MAEYIEKETLLEVVNNLRLGRHLNKDAALNLMERAINNLPAADVIEVGSCDGCHWKGMGRFQKCTYCRRNRNLKDRFEERRGEDGTVN